MHASETKISPTHSGFVTVPNGRIYWEYFGAGTRPVLCLMNGLAMSTESWHRLLPQLLGASDVLLYDYFGQGRSESTAQGYSIPDSATHLVAILDELRIATIDLLGISYGGFVALDFARLGQERLRTLTLSGILLSHEELFQRYHDLSLRFYRSGALGFELYTHYMYEKIFGESFMRRAKAHLEKMRLGFYERYRHRVDDLIRLTQAQEPFFAALERNLDGYRTIETPTLVMAGADDRVILPRVQRKICDILPRSRFELIADSGHVVYLEEPEAFFGRLDGHMGSVRRSAD